MRQIGWSVVGLFALAGACQGSKVEEQAPATAGTSASAAGAGSGGGGTSPVLGIGYPIDVAGTGAQSTGGTPDLSSVVVPVVHCHGDTAAGGQGGSPDDASGGAPAAKVAPPGGAPWDDECSLPASQCVDGLTLVYFDEGECVAGLCTWQKRSLNCHSRCEGGGCQDSITTK